MSDAFDPYRKWLGIPQSEQPPHHYRLLGIGLFEDDPDVIESAADQRMSHLRTFQTGAHSALSQKLLNEVSAAKVCLLTKERKAAYDAELRRKLDASNLQSDAPVKKAKPLPPDTATKPTDVDEPALLVTDTNARLRPAHTKQAAGRRSTPVLAVAAVAALFVCGVGAYWLIGRSKPAQIAANPPSGEHQHKESPLASKREAKVTDADPPAVPGSEPKVTPPVAASEPPAPLKPPDAAPALSAETLASAHNGEATSDPGSPPRAIAPFDAKQARAHQEAWAAHLHVPVDQTNSLGMRLVLIPPGEFIMGSTAEQIAEAKKMAEQSDDGRVRWGLDRLRVESPAHRVTMTRPFLVGATEVTLGQYRRFVDATSYVTETEQFGGGSSISKEEKDEQKKSLNWKSPSFPVNDDSAVGQLTWNDAVAFCNWLSEVEQKTPCYHRGNNEAWELSPEGNGYRLPTEAEWEYACRAGTATQFSFGDDASGFDQYGWSTKTGPVPQPHAVGIKTPNPWGLFDMHGNAEEWCQDWFIPDYYAQSPPSDPPGPTQANDRAMRSGAWNSPLLESRSAFRRSYPPHFRFPNVGFRVVCVSTELRKGPRLASAPFDEKQAREQQQTWAEHLSVPVEQKNSIDMRFVLIPPGEFTMGSTAEQIAEATKLFEAAGEKLDDWTLGRFQAELPAHRVTLTRPYLLGATEVTVGQYRRFVEASGYVTESERFGGGSSTSKEETDPQKRLHTWKAPSYPVSDDSAVSQLTWNDTVAFCNWLSEAEKKKPCYRWNDNGEWVPVPAGDGYRLPTEAEWEYACRAGTTTQYSFGDDVSAFEQYGWSLRAGPVPHPHLVAVKRPNAWGLFDMHGNVEEWCYDWFGPDYYQSAPSADPAGPGSAEGRIRRGGAEDMPIARCRSAFRGAYSPIWRFGDLGFRVMSVSIKLRGDTGALEIAQRDPTVAREKSTNDAKTKAKPDAGNGGEQLAAQETFTLKDQHVGAVTRVAFHPSLPLLASAGKDGHVLLWNLDKKSLAGEFARFKVEVWALKFSPNGELLTYGSRDWWKAEVDFKTVDAAREVKSLGDFKFGGGAVASIAFSADGLFFAAGQDDGTIRLWNTSTFQELAPLSMGSNVLALAFGPQTADRKHKRTDYLLAAGCQDGTLKTLAIAVTKAQDDLRVTFEPTDTAFPKLGSVLAARFSPDGKLLGCTRSGGLVALYDAKDGKSVREMQATAGEANWISFHPQQPWCVTAHKTDRVARVWNTEMGRQLRELSGHTGGVLCAEFSRDGRQIATASEDFSIKVWDLSGLGVPGAAKRMRKGKAAAAVVGD